MPSSRATSRKGFPMSEPSPHARADLSLFANTRYDLPAGLVVFLVALPLCLGIAVASGAPPAAGIIAGIVGGIVIPPFSKSALSVSVRGRSDGHRFDGDRTAGRLRSLFGGDGARGVDADRARFGQGRWPWRARPVVGHQRHVGGHRPDPDPQAAPARDGLRRRELLFSRLRLIDGRQHAHGSVGFDHGHRMGRAHHQRDLPGHPLRMEQNAIRQAGFPSSCAPGRRARGLTQSRFRAVRAFAAPRRVSPGHSRGGGDRRRFLPRAARPRLVGTRSQRGVHHGGYDRARCVHRDVCSASKPSIASIPFDAAHPPAGSSLRKAWAIRSAASSVACPSPRSSFAPART